MPLTPRRQRAIVRMKRLIETGNQLAAQFASSPNDGDAEVDQNMVNLRLMLPGELNLLCALGHSNPHYGEYMAFIESHKCESLAEIESLLNILKAALDDLETEDFVNVDWPTMVWYSKHLADDAQESLGNFEILSAAEVGRKVIEQPLSRLLMEACDFKRVSFFNPKPLTEMNDSLRDSEVYGSEVWRQINGWINTIERAEDGEASENIVSQLSRMLDEVPMFVSNYYL